MFRLGNLSVKPENSEWGMIYPSLTVMPWGYASCFRAGLEWRELVKLFRKRKSKFYWYDFTARLTLPCWKRVFFKNLTKGTRLAPEMPWKWVPTYEQACLVSKQLGCSHVFQRVSSKLMQPHRSFRTGVEHSEWDCSYPPPKKILL